MSKLVINIDIMKIAHIIQCLGAKSGGPSRSVYNLVKGLRTNNVDALLLTTNVVSNPNIGSDEWIECINKKEPGMFEYTKGFDRLIRNSIADVYHIQALFSHASIIAPRIIRKMGKPYIISPRGTLYANALNQSRIKKKIFMKLILERDLNKAAALQATCIEELNEIRNLGIKTPIAVIPNAINIPQNIPKVQPKNGKFRLGYVGRINHIKNIDGLIKAWYLAGFAEDKNAELVIIGGANLDYEKTHLMALHKLESELGITNIVWAGMKQGVEKDALLRTCTVTVLPSHSENFGMVVPEALIQGVPVIASDKTPWNILENAHCGWSTQNSPESMAQIIRLAHSKSASELQQMGLNGQRMVIDNFSTEKISEKLTLLYKWVLGQCEKPNFVYE